MDVRCEKCQTEYELDEARLKPGGVTVKCTNCGHMFKIRKRSTTNVGAPPVQDVTVNQRVRAPSNKPPTSNDDPTVSTRPAPAAPARADSVIADISGDGPTVPDRQWLIRLENGEQKSCRELAVLQQWIVAGVVTRESLISRTGKTWKRLGDVGELAQYFVIADEARASRGNNPSKPPASKAAPAPTMLGVGPTAQAAGGRIVPDDDDDIRTTGSFSAKARPSTPPPPPPVKGATRPPPTPPPQQPLKPNAGAEKSWAAMPASPEQRATGTWASASPAPSAPAEPAFGGRISAVTDEPAFAAKSLAGKVRTEPGDERVFSSGPTRRVDEERDDEDMFPSRRGSRSGMLLVVVALLVIGGAAAVIYIFAFKNKGSTEKTAAVSIDAAVAAAAVTPDAAVAIDAPSAVVVQPVVKPVQGELNADVESRLRTATADDPGVKAHVMLALAQTLIDQANLSTDKAGADKQNKEAKQLVLDAATLAQKQLKAKADDPAASLAMAEVLRLQNKPGKDIKRYIDAAAVSKDWSRDASIATTLVLARDGKLDDAAAALRGLDTDAADVRPKFRLAMIAFQQNKPADAKPLVDQVLATQPEHAGAKALAARLAVSVAKTDPMPTEEPGKKNPPPTNGSNAPVPTAMEGYDALIKQANQLAETGSCAKAIELYQKAIAINPSSVEALTGQGYCHIDAKQFSSAFSKFRAALTIKQNYEPALFGIAQAYQQQGRKQDAIDAYKAYLEVFPASAKAQKQLAVLGGGDAPAPTPTPTPTPPPSSPTVTPDKPTETPPPAPAPAPDQGSAS